jgi:hypothetical protein
MVTFGAAQHCWMYKDRRMLAGGKTFLEGAYIRKTDQLQLE